MPGVSKRATIQDVARAAGASPGVVSSVLNGNRHKTTRVSAETQERIRQAAVRLGYRPNALARSLQRQQTQTILFATYFVSSLRNSRDNFFTSLLDGALMAATRRGYDLMIHLVHREDSEKVAILGDGRADGCLWVGPAEDDPILPRLHQAGWPLVTFGARLAAATANVVVDNYAGMQIAVDHLLALGHSRIAFVNQSLLNYEGVERSAAYAAACRARGIAVREITAVRTPPDDNGRTDVLRETILDPLRDRQTRPTGIIAFNDSLAGEVMRCARQVGIDIPRQLSIIGIDSTDFCETLSPRLTSLRQPLREMAERCIEILVENIGQPGDPAQEPDRWGRIETFPCQLDIRASTAPPS